MTEPRATFDALVARSDANEHPIPDAELDAFWATLPPVTVPELLGEWKGGAFNTAHPLKRLLTKANWYGKNMKAADDVEPIVCLDESGTKFSNETLSRGGASLWAEEFRGEVTATMVYDGQPIHDHFKRVDADTVMGIMNGKSGLVDGHLGYFYLQRER